MKKILLVLTVLVGSAVLWYIAKPDPIKPIVVKPTPTPDSKISIQDQQIDYVFVPYWSFDKEIDAGNLPLIYFGIGVNSQGVDVAEHGYKKLSPFLNLTKENREKTLTVRMVDKDINSEVLKSLSLQEKIATQSVAIASDSGFAGILLDFETSALGFESTTRNITNFYKLFSDSAKKEDLKFYVTLYGDTYFRTRPYNVKQIGEMSDKVFIMAYDFSKARGNPGPNFPLKDTNLYGYDFSKMVDDFQKDVDNKKLVVVLGYFGYDWRVDGSNNSLATGSSLSTLEITNGFIKDCKYKLCSLRRVQNTDEPSITYTDENNENHIIWFEDEVSISKKKEFLKTKGILQTASWAYSYY